jgi:MFS family permease
MVLRDGSRQDVDETAPLLASGNGAPPDIWRGHTEDGDDGDGGDGTFAGHAISRTWTLEVITFLYAIVLFAMSTASTQLVQKIVCTSLHSRHTNASQTEDEFCDSSVVADPTADYLLYFQLASVIPAFFTVPYFASVADHTGRRKGVIVSCAGSVLYCIGFMLLDLLKFNLQWMYVPLFIYGMCGNLGLLLMAVFASVADITTKV